MPGGRMSSVVGTIPRTEVNEGSATGCEGVAQRGEEEQDDEGEEDLREGSAVLFVNRGGLPVDEATWERMWRHVARIHPEGEDLVRRIRGANDLPKIPIPSVPTFQPSASTSDRLEAIQRFIRDLQYNHTGTQFFEIKKNRPLTALLDIAKEMIREALPIKCLEAVILGIYLTNSIPGLERFPLSFKTQFSGNYFRHIVLGVHSGGRFGALGISRREDLMYKPLTFRTLSELVQEFDVAYHRLESLHRLHPPKTGRILDLPFEASPALTAETVVVKDNYLVKRSSLTRSQLLTSTAIKSECDKPATDLTKEAKEALYDFELSITSPRIQNE
ncbi:tubulinyl-Tyr carboxypeptidase 1 isoform X2 [Polypterus senegalus]|uniref:tubulinyl-Tyr carboxypeptidase 1 isoform X2 n=1 Tax=Polypterus senegalus TaxID=55291 RepID=UPI0019652664|nr:tubulinyl-Tyr carboxypeptidase 1 isoform X2 [Polypterus senegalus]